MQAQNFGKVAVLAGGFSSEREVSLNSGKAVCEALKSKGIDAHLFDPHDKPIYRLVEEKFQAAFNVLHGTYGEDGVVQGALEALGIPYTGSGVMASAISMDKFHTRLVWQSAGLPNVPYVVLNDDSDFAAVEEAFGFPLFVKPAAEGSSVGVQMIENQGELAKAYPQLKQYHGVVLAEKAIMGGEYACSIVGDRALPSIRIIPNGKWYDYEAKYYRDDTVYQCPSDLSAEKEQYERLGSQSLSNFRLHRLGACGFFERQQRQFILIGSQYRARYDFAQFGAESRQTSGCGFC